MGETSLILHSIAGKISELILCFFIEPFGELVNCIVDAARPAAQYYLSSRGMENELCAAARAGGASARSVFHNDKDIAIIA